MKKYTIKDKSGAKKIIYAKDLSHALTLADSSLNDSTYELYLGNDFHPDDWAQIRNAIKRFGLYVEEYRKGMQTITVHGDRKNLEKLLTYFGHYKGYSKEYNNIKDSIKDAVSLIKGDWFTLRRENDVLYKVIDDQRKTINGFREAMMVEVYQITFTKDYKEYTIKKVGNESFHPDRWSSSDIVRFNSAEEAMNWLKRQLQLTKHRFDSKAKDEANLPTTIQALVNDEEAAIKAYEVAIKNLEGKIDETQMQVLINIMKDERRHVENLYAILNGKVTEKNLEDSIKDAAPGVDEKKFNRLVSYFDVWGKPSKGELQDVIDYYRLNSATAYQLLIYWGYKDEFKKLHFYDSLSKAVK